MSGASVPGGLQFLGGYSESETTVPYRPLFSIFSVAPS